MVKHIIGISGKKGSGKDEICKFIMSLFPNTSQRIAFADPLKLEVANGCKVPLSYLNDEHKDNFRLIMQGWGTDYRRKLCGENYWIEQWNSLYMQSTAELVIVPDVRFINEAVHIHNIAGHLIRVNRMCSDLLDEHISERQLDNYNHFDAIINNNDSIQELHKNILVTLAQLNIHTP